MNEQGKVGEINVIKIRQFICYCAATNSSQVFRNQMCTKGYTKWEICFLVKVEEISCAPKFDENSWPPKKSFSDRIRRSGILFVLQTIIIITIIVDLGMRIREYNRRYNSGHMCGCSHSWGNVISLSICRCAYLCIIVCDFICVSWKCARI